MPIFGGILPFIGWRVVNVDVNGDPCDGPTFWLADAFVMEWLGCGVCLYIGKVWANGGR